ncbi:MAG: hypothetical protein RR573_04830 [Oscillospiraceae bacterium]
MLKSVKYTILNSAKLIAIMLAILMGAFVFCKLAYPVGADDNLQMFSMYLGMLVVMPFAGAMSGFAYYSNIAISMGASRRHYFWGAQISKLATVAGFTVEAILGAFVFNKLLGVTIIDISQNNISILLMLAFVMLCLACVGESIGILSVRFGKLGMALYIIVCLIMGGLFGFLIGFGDSEKIFTKIIAPVMGLFNDINTFVIAILLTVSILTTALNYFFSRKLTVR